MARSIRKINIKGKNRILGRKNSKQYHISTLFDRNQGFADGTGQELIKN
jgi:hypothetical protein